MKFIHVISYMFATEFYTFLSWLVLSYPESKRILILILIFLLLYPRFK